MRLFSSNNGIKSLLVLFSFILLSACASKMSLIQTGPWHDAHDVKNIKYFASKNQIKKSWIAIAVIRGDKINPSNRKKINKEIERAKQLAANIGGDGVVLVEKRVKKNTALFARDIGKVFITGIVIQYVTEEQAKQNQRLLH
jgi:K+-sensing histidine kinase KdpD